MVIIRVHVKPVFCLCVRVATELVTVYVFQEPSMLSPLQANGLTDVVLQALLVKDVSYPGRAFEIQ